MRYGRRFGSRCEKAAMASNKATACLKEIEGNEKELLHITHDFRVHAGTLRIVSLMNRVGPWEHQQKGLFRCQTATTEKFASREKRRATGYKKSPNTINGCVHGLPPGVISGLDTS